MKIAKAAGFAITSEDIQSKQSELVELSDEELEGAAGGGETILERLIEGAAGAVFRSPEPRC